MLGTGWKELSVPLGMLRVNGEYLADYVTVSQPDDVSSATWPKDATAILILFSAPVRWSCGVYALFVKNK